MKKIKSNVKFIAIIIAFLILPLNINAKQAYEIYTIEDNGLDISEYLNDDVIKNDKIVICGYKCSEDNKTNCGDTIFSAIYYKHNNSIRSGNWEIETNLNLTEITPSSSLPQIKEEKYSLVWEEFGNTVPYSGIYFEQSTSNDKNDSWKNSSEYKNLQTSFICPKYMYFDHSLTNIDNKNNNMELCYANEKEKCMNRNEDGKTKFGKLNMLNYDFTTDLNNILDSVIAKIETDWPETIFAYDFTTQQKDVCDILKTNNTDTFVELMTNENMVRYLDDKFKLSTTPGKINNAFYNYENVTKLFVLEKSKNPNLNIIYNNIPLLEKYNKIESTYITRVEESIDYYKEKCNISDVSNVEAEQVKAQLQQRFDTLFPNYQKLEFTELDCDNIFADIADMIKTGYFVIELIAILLVVVLTIVDYAQVILSDNQDEMKKSNKKLTTRLIIVAVILLLPALINMILKMLHIQGFNSEKPLCVEIKNK